MNTDWDILGPSSLKFFGRITATNAHELNNTIGIINESAGLMEDLGLLAKNGSTPPDIDKWVSICKKISTQVHRANETIKNLNVFAHCTDRIKETVYPENLVNLVVNLSKRPLDEKRVTAIVIPQEKPGKILIHQFLFLKLIGDCLSFAADNADEKREIAITISHDSKRLTIEFSGLDIEDKNAFDGIIKEELSTVLDVKITLDKDKISLLIFPDKSSEKI